MRNKPGHFASAPTAPVRPPRWAAVVLMPFIAVLPGCGNVANPFASFMTRCGALPPARFHVTTAPFEFTEDDTLGVAELTARSGASMESQRTLGLTVANFGHETESRLHLLEERGAARTCGTADVEVTLSMTPTWVYVARELRDDQCRHDATRAHEMRHVTEYRALLAEAARRLEGDLPAAIGTGLLTAASGVELRERFETALRGYMSGFMRAEHEALAARQATIDTPEEYARVAAACRG